ncbi:MAG: alpha/beta hydrolase [Halioglobus sp.]
MSSGGFQLVVHQWVQTSATSNLLVVHGFLDHTGLFSHLIDYGLQHNCNVVCFDLPGHGLSSGEATSIDDFGQYSQAIADVLAALELADLPWWAMAQSTGCAALIDFAPKHPWPFVATVLLAPLIRPAAWNRMRVSYALLNRFIKTVKRTFVVNSGDAEFLAFLQSDPLQSHRISIKWVGALRLWLADLVFSDLGVGPALVVQGDADGTVDWRYNMQHITTLFPHSQIEYLDGAGHQLANETLECRSQYLAKVGSYVGLA